MASKEYALIIDQGSNASLDVPATSLEQNDLGLNPPMKLNRDSIVRSYRSHFQGQDAEFRFKNLIVKTFSSSSTITLEKACLYIASDALKTYYPKLQECKAAMLCCIVDTNTFKFNEKFKKGNKVTYLEYQLNTRSSCVVIIKHLTGQEKQKSISSSIVKELKNQAAALALYET